MNRCVTCGKIVTRLKARNTIELGDHCYLVCCPICEKEFMKDPEHYMAVTRSVFGDYAVNAHSRAGFTERENTDMQVGGDFMNYIQMLRNLQDDFSEIQRKCRELDKHFDSFSNSGGLIGLRSVLKEHRAMMDSLQKKITIHAGVCQFVVSVAEPSMKAHL